MAIGDIKDYGKWDVYRQSYSRRELLERRTKLAKVANSRIRNLERATSEISGNKLFDAPWYNNVKSYLDTRERTRFSESKYAKDLNDNALRREIVVLENFLNTKSSTVKGSREIEEKRIAKFMEKKVPEEIARSVDFYDFLVSETFEQIVLETVSSEDVVDIIYRASDKFDFNTIVSKFEEHLTKKEGGSKALYKSFGLKMPTT